MGNLQGVRFFYIANGVASATKVAEAVCYGLLEVIERDAITCDHFRSRAAGWHLPLDLVQWKSVDHPVLKELLSTIRAAPSAPQQAIPGV